MSEGISLSGLWNAFSKFVWQGGITGSPITGCSSKPEEATPSVEEILAARQAARQQKDAGTAAPPVTCEPNRMVIQQETVIFGSAKAGKAFSLAPFNFVYADVSGEKEFPKECKLTVADQSMPTQVNETAAIQSAQMEPVVDGGMSIMPIAIQVTPEGTLTIATAGEYDVGISCLAPNAFSMEKIGSITITQATAAKPIASRSGKGKKTTKVKKTVAGPCNGLSGIFLSACKKNNNL